MQTQSSNRLLMRLTIAAEIWEEIEKTAYPADRWLGNYFHRNRKRMGSQDRRFYSELIYGLFRHKTYVTHVAGTFNERPGILELILLTGALEGVLSENEFHSIETDVFKKNAAKLPKNFYQQFLDYKFAAPGKDASSLSLRYSFPEWLVEHWQKNLGFEKTESLLNTCQMRPDLVVRANSLKVTREKLMSLFTREGYQVSPTSRAKNGIIFKHRIGIFALEEFQKGYFEVQDEGSQLICENMRVKPTDLVWDVCAGAGGKSLGLAAVMHNKGRIVATDIRPKKLQDLKKRAKRAGAFNIFPADLDRMDELKIALSGFDKILVDAPCSGSGTLRRNPDAKWKLSPERFQEHHDEQVKIICSVWPRLKKGGFLYYATCSVDELENEKTLEKAAGILKDMRLSKIDGLGEQGVFGNRLWPSKENDGFFLAAAEKI